jgi:hypothetical protein
LQLQKNTIIMSKTVTRWGFILLTLIAVCTLSMACSSDDDKTETQYVFKVRDPSAAYRNNYQLSFMVQNIIVRQYDDGVAYFQVADDEAAKARFVKARNDLKQYNWAAEFTLSEGTYFTLQLVDGKRVVASEIINLK